MSGDRFQVVGVTARAGKGASGKPYSLVVVDGVYLSEDGKTRSTAEHVIFADKDGKFDQPIPVQGQVYEPVPKMYVNRDKKLVAGIFELKPVVGK